MKHILSVLIVVFFLTCAQKKDTRITNFENSLGELETKYLNKVVNDFDSFLNKKYKNDEMKFKKYLTAISESEQPEVWKIDYGKFEEIKETNLFAKYDSIFPDSVWYDNKVFYLSFPNLGMTNSIAFINSKPLNIDSLIHSLKNEPRLEEIEPSYLQIALETVGDDDDLVKNYLNAKEVAGTISIRLVARGLLYSLKPENEYFAKRILIMEMND